MNKKAERGPSTAEFQGLYLVGGDPALDFVNTVKYRGLEDDGDRLISLGSTIHWAHVAGLIDQDELSMLLGQSTQAADRKRVHDEIRSFREAARIVIEHHGITDTDHDKACREVEVALASLSPVPALDRNDGRLTYSIPIRGLGDLKARIVACVGTLLEKRSDHVIKSCDGEDCDWVFIDRTKAKRRRWCDTRTCGNVARVRKHREHHKNH